MQSIDVKSWIGLGLLLPLLLGGCGAPESASTANDQPQAPKKPVAYRSDWVPKAEGTGNFEVCLSSEAEENDVRNVTLPVGMVFDSWGHMTGNLRNSMAYDGKGAPGPGGDQYAVALTTPVRLTTAKPCAITKARALTNQGFRYQHDTVPQSLHYSFAASGLYLNKKGGISNQLKGPAGNAAQIGVLNGTPVADIGDPYHASDDDG